MNRSKQTKRSALALAILLAIAAPTHALAQDASPQTLEARIAQLEQMVQVLKSELDAQKAADADAAAKLAAAPPPANPIQATTVMPAAAPGTKFSFGGFIKLDAMLTNTDSGEIADGSTGRLFYVPSTIPVGGADEGTDLDMHAQFSRLWFGADSEIAGRKVKAYLEMDLFGGALGNEISTNTYGVTIRHAYVSWGNWLAGQTWSNFQDVAALPDAIDFVGPTEGTIFVRDAQVRYTRGPWSVSLENPETTVAAFGTGARFNSDDNNVPDVTLRYLHKGDWGHFTVAGLARQLKFETPTSSESESAFAVSVSGKWNLGASDDIRYMLSGGNGLGRYLAFGLGPDAMQASDGSLEALDATAGFVAWRHVFSPQWRSNVFYSVARFDNDTALTGLGVTESAQSIHANLIYSPFPKLDVGAELIFGERELESGATGEMNRLHMHVKYNF
ncbi:MAG TPA: DcaP family trimeric outer membrane transporter [Arenimonas sp.]|uniref:DcaP family trimeric outer membrane transporter n=1 Tax=Arenimonas sp. TaxID=1872635 RepID=UPI002D8046FD|nr:DcaP family trimeric outer membrane transporter [Arenimonas sp.]HEU0153261.1 DcaP family trimeric outer membrane transporter [Arenimonas sp.]